jgi:hypothetical protein
VHGLRAIGVALLACFATAAHADVTTIGSPGANASIGAHRLVVSGTEIVWPSFIGVHALDTTTGRTRSLSHCGTAVQDIAVFGPHVYVLADHSVLCRVPLATGQSVQMLVQAPGVIIDGFAVSAAAVAYATRKVGDQPGLRVMTWGGVIHDYVTAVPIEHIAIDATTVAWVDAGTLLRASIASGAKTVGPTITNHVQRIVVDRGVVYVATDHDVLRLAPNARAWTTLSTEGADDLVADGASVYVSSSTRGTITKLGAGTLAKPHAPWALALDGASLFFATDAPFIIQQIAPR